jgi:hypothetical protein
MKTNYEINKSIRCEWGINPVTKVVKSKKVYNRKSSKIDLKKQLKNI